MISNYNIKKLRKNNKYDDFFNFDVFKIKF